MESSGSFSVTFQCIPTPSLIIVPTSQVRSLVNFILCHTDRDGSHQEKEIDVDLICVLRNGNILGRPALLGVRASNPVEESGVATMHLNSSSRYLPVSQ
jgi:hypothetical protein